MKQEALRERVELLEVGEALGYPRLGYGRSTKIPHDRRIPAGKEQWEKFAAHAHVRRLLPALRISRVLRDNNVVPYNPPGGRVIESIPIALPSEGTAPSQPVETVDLLEDITLDTVVDTIPPEIVVPNTDVVPLPRPKRGGHKQPPRPGTKRWIEQEKLAHG